MLFEPRYGAVERARPKGHAGELLDVFRQRVAMLRAAGEAGQDQHRWVVRPAEGPLFSHVPDGTTWDVATQYVVTIVSAWRCAGQRLAGRIGRR